MEYFKKTFLKNSYFKAGIFTFFLGIGSYFGFGLAFGYGGSSFNFPAVSQSVTAINVPLTVSSGQSGSASKDLGGMDVRLEVPKGSVDGQTTFLINSGSLETHNTPLDTSGAVMLGNQTFNVEAKNIENQPINDFIKSLSFSIIMPDLPADTSNLGVYYFEKISNQWKLIPGAVFNQEQGKISFSVSHLTDFAVFEILGRPDFIDVVAAGKDKGDLSGGGTEDIVSTQIQISNEELFNNIRGRIILKVENNGEAYYINPRVKIGYYLGRPDDAFAIMRGQGIGITSADLEKIEVGLSNLTGSDTDKDGLSDLFEDAVGTDKNNPDTDGDGFNDKEEFQGNYDPFSEKSLDFNVDFANKQDGKIFLQVENHGEAWYIYGNKRYYLGRPSDAFNIMRYLGLGISNKDFDSLDF